MQMTNCSSIIIFLREQSSGGRKCFSDLSMYAWSMYLLSTNKYEILRHLNKLNTKKANDIYNSPSRVIKSIADLIADPLAIIMINNSLSTGVFPQLLKCANVTPLFKSGLKNDIQNYRPISVLPIFDKILEKIA